jgi:signal recognition particle subunit SRP54
VAADPRRVAATEQLVALGKQLNIPVLADSAQAGTARPADLSKRALQEAKRANLSTLIVDSVGYVQIEPDDQAELAALRDAFGPTEVLLVADAMTGQEAVHAAEQFHQAVGLTGLILTKLDGDARGGAALSIRAVTGIPIKFVGTGEKTDALEPFYPDRFASRILGMGDLLTLIEKAKEQFTDDDVASLTERMRKGNLSLEDFLLQFQRMKSMGPLNQLFDLVPGLSSARNRLNMGELDESFLNKAEAIIYSMTPEERRHPDIIDGSRRRRIARGSGTQPADVNQLLKQYREAKRVMQMMMAGGRGHKAIPFLR